MEKRYIKKTVGVDALTVMKKAPIWGKVPFDYRGKDWNIDSVWYNNIGINMLDSIDPFNDGSLIHKWRLNGNLVDTVTGINATLTGVESYSDGVFDSKCFSTLDNVLGGTYIDCGVIDRQGSEEITISGWINVSNNSNLYINTTWCNVWHLTPDGLDIAGNSRQPALFINQSDAISYQNDGSTTANLGKSYGKQVDLTVLDRNKPSIFNKWIHITQVVTKHTMKLYIDGIHVDTVNTPEDFLFNNGTFFIGDTYQASTNKIQQVEIYIRALKDSEVQELYNQERLLINKYDGSDTNSVPFTYVEEEDKLVELITDKEGNVLSKQLVTKEGYIYSEDNLVKEVQGELVDRYGNNVLSGKVNRVIQNTSYTYVSVTTAGFFPFNTFTLDMDTSKYDYIISVNNSLYNDSIGATGADINITANGTSLITSGHIGYNLIGYIRALTYTPKVVEGYIGKVEISANMAKFDSTLTYTVTNSDNGGVLSGRDFPNNKSDIIVFEIHKDK